MIKLTKREREVVKFAEQGLTAKDIARNLSLSPRTVESHIHHIITKVGARNMRRAILLLREREK